MYSIFLCKARHLTLPFAWIRKEVFGPLAIFIISLILMGNFFPQQLSGQVLTAPKIYFPIEDVHSLSQGMPSMAPGAITSLHAKPNVYNGHYLWADRFWIAGEPGADNDVASAAFFYTDENSSQGLIINDPYNATTSFFGIDPNAGEDVEALTISCWVYVDPAQSTRRYLLYGQDTNEKLGFGLSLKGEDLYLIKYVNNATAPKGDALGTAVVGNSWESSFLGPAKFTAGAGWYQVILVQAPYYTRLFVGNPPEKVNGQWQGKKGKFNTDFGGSMVLHGKQDLSSFSTWGMGRPEGHTSKIPVDGVDDFMVFDYAMTEAQAEALYQCQVAHDANTCFGTSQTYTQSFAIIGDYGCDGGSFNGITTGTGDVADMVKGWSPDFILTVGDDSYHDSSSKGCSTDIDDNVGKYYHDYISPYSGSHGSGSANGNKFFPVMGNHDDNCLSGESDNGTYNCTGRWENYFSGLPNNQRYYKFTQGNIEFFAINSNLEEPDSNKYKLTNGNLGVQAQWLKTALQTSTATFKVVYMHHAPYSSYNASDESKRGSNREMLKWPFKALGADIVISGDDHYYERNDYRNLTYVVNGLGGMPTLADIDTDRIVAGNRVHVQQKFGAIKVESNSESMHFEFYTIDPANRSNIQVEDEFYLYKRPDGATYLLESPKETEQIQTATNVGSLKPITVYPNPTSGRLIMRLDQEIAGTATVRLLGVSGKLLMEQQHPLVAGLQEIYLGNLRAKGFAAGVYFVQVVGPTRNETVKIVLN